MTTPPPAVPPPAGPTPVARTRVRLLAASLALVGLAFVQDPGLLIADTKFDLATDPGFFLQRALHLWDPDSAFGQLQNQAYGYLWPMGPVFWLGDLLGIPGWAVQRLWLGLVMVVAFLGSARLARALGVRSDLACVLAGLAYALSPRALSIMGSISIEQWPSALAPWVLLPLVRGSTTGSARRAAMLAAVAVAMVGGVNAAATFAVLPLGVVWLLTRSPGPRRRTLMLWWPVFTLLGTLWWLVPLFVLGAYSPPFLDFIESASNTTFSTDLFDSLRGTSNWVPYVEPELRAGNDLIRTPALIVTGAAVVLFGLLGLLHPRNPHRLFLGCSLLLGLVMVTLGHTGSAPGWFATDVQEVLDGALAPLRNVHKFDPVVRLPLVLGLAWAVDSWVASLRRARDGGRADGAQADWARRLNDRLLVGTAVVAVLASALPMLTGRIAPVGATSGIPDYWADAASWLEDRPGTTLLLPGSSFGEYVWGSPRDEPFQSLARSPWAVRNAVPLAPPGNIRMLDAIERRISQGQGSTGLAPYLRRAGVRYLLVRNDLVRTASVPDPVLVHQALADSPGIERVAGFGGEVGGEAHLEDDEGLRILINSGWQDQFEALELYEVAGEWSPADTAEDPPVVVGGPEDLLDLADLGVLDDGPTRLAADLGTDAAEDIGPVVLTDGLRRVERNFGRLTDGTSATLASDEPLRLDKPARDYTIGTDRWSTTAAHEGGTVSATSSMSDVNAYGLVVPGQQPYAAADGDPQTYWRANYDTTEAARWRLHLPEARAVSAVTLTAGPDERERVRVRVDGEVTEPVVVEAGRSRTVSLDGGETSVVEVEDASGVPGRRLALAEVRVPTVQVSRILVLPEPPSGSPSPDAVVLRAVTDARTGCAEVDGAVRCVPDRDVVSEEPAGFRRRVTLGTSTTYDDVRVVARARPGDGLLRLLLDGQPIGISASTTGNPDPRGSALAAIDGDAGTTWTAATADLRPELRLSWLDRRVVSGLQLEVADDTAARLPEELSIVFGNGRRTTVDVDDDGTVTFAPVRTRGMTIRVREAEAATSLDFSSSALPVPVGISELSVTGLPYAPLTLSREERAPRCGEGPDLVVDGVRVRTAVTASPQQVYEGGAFDVELCDDAAVTLGEGSTDVEVRATDAITPVAVVLGRGDGDLGSAGSVDDLGSGPVSRRLDPDDGSVLALRGNINPGWEATQGGDDLAPLTVDGWRQAWSLDGDDAVTARFAPDRLYRGGLFLGGLCLALLLGLVRWPSRRWPAPDAPPLGAARAPAPLGALLAVGAGGLLAGWGGAALAALTVAAAWLLLRRAPAMATPVVTVAASAALVPVVVAFVLRPWADPEGWAGSFAWPAYLLVVVVVSPLALLVGRRQGGSTSRSRIAGFSTRR